MKTKEKIVKLQREIEKLYEKHFDCVSIFDVAQYNNVRKKMMNIYELRDESENDEDYIETLEFEIHHLKNQK